MRLKQVVRRARVDQDVRETLQYYLEQNSPNAAEAFIAALEQAITHIQHHPATGSPSYAHALDIPGLRFWPFKRFPYQVFYVERPDRIVVWRILHGQRDIPAWLIEDDLTSDGSETES